MIYTLIIPLKVLAAFSIVACYMLFTSVTSLAIRNDLNKRNFQIKSTSKFSKFFLTVTGFKVHPQIFRKGNKTEKNYLIVSNHLSYLDILVIASVYPSVFITSMEVRDTPFLGTLCRLGSSIFIERRNFKNLPGEIDRVADVLREGFNVVLFPEATSSNGEAVLPFKRAFVEASIRACVDVRPICIKYLIINDETVKDSNSDSLFWYGEMTFFRHLIKILRFKKVIINIELLDNIKVVSGSNSKEITNKAYERISSAYAV